MNTELGSNSPTPVPGRAVYREFEFLKQCGAGADGVSYQAKSCRDGCLVEIRVLTRVAENTMRWSRVSKQLRLAALASHHGALEIVKLRLAEEPHFVVFEWFDGESLSEQLRGRPRPAARHVAAVGLKLAETLAEAHLLGFGHADLCPSRIRCSPDGSVKIDFAHPLSTGGPWSATPDSLDRLCHSKKWPSGSQTADSSAEDVYGLGAVLALLLGSAPHDPDLSRKACEASHAEPQVGAELAQLIPRMLDEDPAQRPTATEVVLRLTQIEKSEQRQIGEGATDVSAAMELTEIQAVAPSEVGGQTAGEGAAGLVDTLPPGFRLGRFRLLEPLGQGGWGTVYRAEDTADGSQVAIKLSRRRSGDRHGLARFRKEARLLAEIDSPYAARFIDANESQGIHYLVMEFVAGKSLARLIHEHQRLDEHTAISIVADACRGLTEAHRRGIVHRGIKPDNIIVQCPDRAEPSARGSVSNRIEPPPPALRAKLVDFGLARHMIEPASLQLTGPGTLLGTPLYMAPEQCSGNAVQPEADIYALGATLFHALAGRPPFIGSDIWSVISQHCRDPPPRLQDIRADVSQGVCRLISKALAKTPAGRYAGAGAMLEELECLLRGEAMTFEAHPRLPACDQSRVLQYVFTWALKASPSQLWPHVTNTQRLNQALGLPAVEFHAQVDEGGVAQFAETRVAGMRVAWREHPFEWIEGRRFSVLREFNQGPFKWFFSAVDLDALDDGGTRLTHHVQIEPRSILGRIAAAIEIGLKARRGLESAYRHIDATVTQSESTRDPFQPSPKLGVLRRQRLSKLIARLREQGQNPAVLQCLEQFIGQGPAQELARIRPLALAQRFGLDAHEVVEACLHAAREGLLVLLWDILCPVCRIPATVIDTLRAVRDHASCQACQLDFETDFANSIEMIFRPAPHIREVDLKTYCLGGPSHSPHVVVQVRLAPQERLQVDLSLQEGEYRIRGSRLPATLDFEVRPYGTADRWEVRLGGAASDRAPCLRINRQELKLLNDLPHELLVRIERTATRRDALTAARATAMAVFRKLFPAEVLSPQQLLSVGTMTFLAWEARATTAQGRLDADQLADGIALAQALRFANAMVNCVSAHRGAVFKSLGQPAWAVFDDPELAVRAALGMVSAAGSDAPMPTRTLRVAIHTGPAMAATVNDQLEYFGPTLNTLTELIQCARGGELILSESVTSDPGADLLLREVGPAGPIEDWTSADQRTMVIHRLQAASAV